MSSAFVVAAGMSFAAQGAEVLRAGPIGQVVAVADGDTLVLSSGIRVRLTGIQAPKLPLGRDFEPWPLADEAQAALEGLVLHQEVSLRFGGHEEDRHGRLLAHVFTNSGIWIQEWLVSAGLARVYSFPDNRYGVADLYRAERQARVEKRGIWAVSEYAIRDAHKPGSLEIRDGSYELVEGRVIEAARTGGLVYLNFGRIWNEDFTITIDRAAQKLFEQAGLVPTNLAGALVRVRGWIELRGGPRIEVTHPEQIEVLANQ